MKNTDKQLECPNKVCRYNINERCPTIRHYRYCSSLGDYKHADNRMRGVKSK